MHVAFIFFPSAPLAGIWDDSVIYPPRIRGLEKNGSKPRKAPFSREGLMYVYVTTYLVACGGAVVRGPKVAVAVLRGRSFEGVGRGGRCRNEHEDG
jgi:hypothetical protein